MSSLFIYSAFASLFAIAGAICDIKTRRIPNWLTSAGALTGLMLHLSLDGRVGLLNAASSGLIAGSIFVLLFIAGGMGAGDVKLIAALAAISGLRALPNLLVYTALTGGILGVAMAIAYGKLKQTLLNVGEIAGHHSRHGVIPHPELNVQNTATLRMPYALPMLAGCLINLYMTKAR
jgi:prepilin peptidase CpaA